MSLEVYSFGPEVDYDGILIPGPGMESSSVWSMVNPAPEPEISCVIPAFNEEGNISVVIRAVAEEMIALNRSYEIVVVDDGSRDGTLAEASSLVGEFSLRVIQLSRNFGKESAITAGLEKSRGRAVIVIDADLQEPVSYLGVFIKQWDAGYEMVYGVRADRDDESLFKRWGAKAYYMLLNRTTSVEIPAHSRDFRLMDRKVVDALCSLPERDRFMKGLYSWVGFKSLAVPVRIEPRHSGTSKFNYRKLIGLAMSGLTAFSDWPLRVWTGVGLMVSLVSILYAAYIVLRTMLFGIDVPGWATLTVAVFFLGGIQIFSIGVLGEYLGRIFAEVKGRPGHIVANEISNPKILRSR